jgi:hypothetical protein
MRGKLFHFHLKQNDALCEAMTASRTAATASDNLCRNDQFKRISV